MKTDEINVTRVKKNLLKIPVTKLAEINDFIEFVLSRTDLKKTKRVESLEGIWKGVGFEKIPDLDENIRKIRSESENQMIDRIKKCNI